MPPCGAWTRTVDKVPRHSLNPLPPIGNAGTFTIVDVPADGNRADRARGEGPS